VYCENNPLVFIDPSGLQSENDSTAGVSSGEVPPDPWWNEKYLGDFEGLIRLNNLSRSFADSAWQAQAESAQNYNFLGVALFGLEGLFYEAADLVLPNDYRQGLDMAFGGQAFGWAFAGFGPLVEGATTQVQAGVSRALGGYADDVAGAVDDVVGKNTATGNAKVPEMLSSGQKAEEQALAQLQLPKNTKVFRPTADDVNSALFKIIVGEPKTTATGLLKGTIVDATKGGMTEIKSGTSILDATYQLRLQLYQSVRAGVAYTLNSTRPLTTKLSDLFSAWGASVK
jgi:hypothetical protein